MSSDAKIGLCLDLDGTLADSMPVLERLYFQFLARFDRQGDPAEFRSLCGDTIPGAVRYLHETHGLPGDVGDMIQVYVEMLEDQYGQWAQPMPGAARLLAGAVAAGARVAVVTSATAAMARDFLNRHGLERWVAHVVGAGEVRRHKPHPDPYLAGLALLDLEPPQALAVEDSAPGAASALAAGLETWIMDPAGRGETMPRGVAGVVTDLAQLLPRLGA